MATPRIILDRADRPYELKWCDRAEARLSSLDRPPTFADLKHRRRGYYAMLAIVWASIAERGHRFIEPEDLAEYLAKPEQQSAALDAINAMLDEAYPPDAAEKKNWRERDRQRAERLRKWAFGVVHLGLGAALEPDELTPAQFSALVDMMTPTGEPSGAKRGSFSERAFWRRMVKKGLASEVPA